MLDKRVLVTGASGGVGRFAIQLAHRAGARVTAVARRTAGLAELGADEVLSELEPEGPDFAVILDAVGGPVLGTCLQRVAPGGTVVSFASTVTDPVSYPTRSCSPARPAPASTGCTSSPSCSTPAAPPRTCAGSPSWSPPAGWTRRSTSPSPGSARPRRSRRCWTGGSPARRF